MRRRSRLPISIVVTAVLVLAAEAAVRAAAGTLPQPLEWPDREAQNKVERMDLLERRGGASIVFVGSSMMNAAGDPAAATRLLGARRPAFNAALNGADMRSMEVWTMRVVVPRLRPRAVVIGFSSLELNDNGITQREFYDKLRRSPAVRRALGTAGLLERAEGWVENRSSLFRYRSVLRRPAEALSDRRDAELAQVEVSRLGVLRAIPAFHRRPYSIPPEFRRRTTEESFHAYAVGGAQMAALERLVRGLVARDIRPILVQMPVTDDIVPMHPRGSADFAAFTAALGRCCLGATIPRLDMRAPFGSDPALFVDPVHVSGAGAARFTQTVAAFLRQQAGL